MATSLEILQGFDFIKANIKIWTFKKSQYPGADLPVYTGHWVDTSESLNEAIRAALNSERERISEILDYSVLAQNNEGSALSIKSDETHAHLIIAKIGDETQEKKVKDLKQINNSDFYVIKVTDEHGKKVFAVRRTDESWHARKLKGIIPALFNDDGLDLNEDRSFNISNHIDFFMVNDEILISSKQSFESVLNYKAAHIYDFQSLVAENEFIQIFAETQTITKYVGNNKIRLRRAMAIKQKGHYKNPSFMNNLRANFTSYGLNLTFDINNNLLVTIETCNDVFTALLDHRLTSPFSQNIYDVQNTEPIAI